MKTVIEPTWRVTAGLVVAVVIATLTLYEGAVQSVCAEGEPTAAMAAPVLALYNEGTAAEQAGDFQKAREKFQDALEQAHTLGDHMGIGVSLGALGSVHAQLHEYPKALELLTASLPFLRETKMLVSEGANLIFIGKIHAQMGNDMQAIEALEQGLAIEETALGQSTAHVRLLLMQDRTLAFVRKAGAHARVGQLPQAVETYRQAATAWQAVGDRAEAGQALLEAATIVHLQLKAPHQAVELYAEAWPLLQETGNMADATRAQFGLGESHMEVGHLQEAVAVFSEVVKTAEREGLSQYVVLGYVELVRALEGLGAFEQALALYQPLLQRLRQGDWQGTPQLEPEILAQKGQTHRLLSQYAESIEALRAAAGKYREAQDASGEADTLTQLADVFFALVDYKTAIQYLQQALELYKALGNVPKQAKALAALAESSWLSGESPSDDVFDYLFRGKKLLVLGQESQDKALSPEEYGEWLKTLLSLSLEDRLAVGTFFQKEGRILFEARELDWAVSSLELALVCHASLPDNRDATIEKSKDLYYLAEAYRRKRALDLALQGFREAERLASQLHTPEIHWIYAGLGRTYADMGDAVNAMHHYKNALALLEVVQGQQGLEEMQISTVEAALYVYPAFVAFLLDLYRKTGEKSYLHEAFQATEQLRARAFLNILGKAHASQLGGTAGGLAKKEETLRRQVGQIHHRLRSPHLEKTKETQLLAHLASLQESWRTLHGQAGQHGSQDTPLGRPRPVRVEEVQAILDADSVVLEYAIGYEHITLWAITKEQIHAYQLPRWEGLSTLEPFLHTLRAPLLGAEEVAQHVALGQQLYQTLVKPAERQLQRKKHLLLAPDGPLYYLPFEALILPTASGNHMHPRLLAQVPYMVKHFQVTYIPSASVLVTQRRAQRPPPPRAPLPLVAFGDPLYEAGGDRARTASPSGPMEPLALRDLRWQQLRDAGVLSRLPFAGEEVRRIAHIWGVPLHSVHINVRQQATVARVRALDLSQYRIVHFAVHGVMEDNVGLATQPALVLAQGQDEEQSRGLLQVTDIVGLHLKAALVVLSACDTGLGRLRAGEGIVGLTRAFLQAGAASVVASLWKVEDQSTSRLMEHFYRYLKQGRSKAAALRQAKLAVLQERITLKALGKPQSLASPFYWAPFILIGDWH